MDEGFIITRRICRSRCGDNDEVELNVRNSI